MRVALASAGIILLFPFPLLAQCTLQEIIPPTGATEDWFGSAVAADGDRIVVGAPFHDAVGEDTGAAFVYQWTGEEWTLEAELYPQGAADGYWFGFGVSIQGDTIVGGAIRANGFAGSATVFRHDGSDWIAAALLVAADADPDDSFGFSTAIDGDLIVVGASGDDESANGAGAAYVFRELGPGFVQEAKLLALDAESFDTFGISVSISGDIIGVGAESDDDVANNAGAAYVFRYDGLTWIQEAKLTASTGTSNDHFGRSLSLDGDRLAVGAFNRDAAYIYEFEGTDWFETAVLTEPSPNSFGASVSLDGDSLLVGDYQGPTYLFELDGGAWQQELELFPVDVDPLPDANPDLFGFAVALSGPVAVVGGLHHTVWEPDSGAAFVFRGDSDCIPFRRGDANLDGGHSLADPIVMLLVIFLGAPQPCLAALDADDNEDINIIDPIYLLAALFQGGSLPPSPFLDCNFDTTGGDLPCQVYDNCP